MSYFGALIHPYSNIAACSKAVTDLELDLVVLEVNPTVYPWTTYDDWYKNLSPQSIVMMLSLPNNSTWSSVSPAEFGSQAAMMASRYPEVARFLCINEPNVSQYYPPTGIAPQAYMKYFNAMQAAILKERGLTGLGQGSGITSGPQTSALIQSYWGLLAAWYDVICFHPYGSSTNPSDGNYVGNTVKPLQQNNYRYACTEWEAGAGSAPAIWQACLDTGFQYAIYYELQDSQNSPNTGLLDQNGSPVQPYYNDAKEWLAQYHRRTQ